MCRELGGERVHCLSVAQIVSVWSKLRCVCTLAHVCARVKGEQGGLRQKATGHPLHFPYLNSRAIVG